MAKCAMALQHGDLDMATFIVAAALHERAQNAVRRVDAGNGVGERRTQESGRLESTTTLRKPLSAWATES